MKRRWLPPLERESREWGVDEEERRHLLGAVRPMLYLGALLILLGLLLLVLALAEELA